ncbi:MAG TPA: hypothetical protein VF265_00375 [Nevskiaceae bacterium]
MSGSQPFVLGAKVAPANIGANIDGVVYYSSSQQYVDMIRQAAGWSSTATDKVHGAGVNLQSIGAVDAAGWPTQDASFMVMCCTVSNDSAADPGEGSPLYGSYRLSFNGKARIGVLSSRVVGQAYDPQTNVTTATVDVLPTYQGKAVMNNMALTFTDTQRTADSPVNTGIANIHLIRPQMAPNGQKWWDSPDQTFTNPFLASLAPFTTLRFMDWVSTNGNQQEHWADRTPGGWPNAGHVMETADGQWVKTGQSWESAIELANTLRKDMWINVPAHADDDYVLQLATLVHDRLDPSLHVYVEYSNEVWNYGFEQWSYNNQVTKALLAGDAQAAANYAANCIGWANDVCHTAERLYQVANIFADTWGKAEINDRVRPVFCGQAVQPSMLQMALSYIDKTYGSPKDYFYGLCSAPYWGATVTAGQSLDDLLAASKASIPVTDSYLLSWAAAARFYGLHNFTYEGGEGLTDRPEANLATMLAASRDPRMGAQVTEALSGAFANGVDMYMYFTSSGGWSKYGAWGATDDIFDLANPKYAALAALAGKDVERSLDVVSTVPGKGVAFGGFRIPGTINAFQTSFRTLNGMLRPDYQAPVACGVGTEATPASCSPRADATNRGGIGYLVVAPAAGSYAVSLVLGGTEKATAAATAQYYVNGAAQGGSVAIPATAKGEAVQAPSVVLQLSAGVSTLALEATGGSFSVQSLVVTQ